MSDLHAILVDDEDFVLDGLTNAIDWKEYGIRIAGYANNGSEALELLRHAPGPVDIVITDIKMPVMDGFQLTEALRAMNHPCKVIMLTGHEEFDFAKKAIRYGVFEYLLKPVELDAITEMLHRLTETIRTEKQRLNENSRVETKLQESLPLLQEKLLFSMLKGDYEPELLAFNGLPMKAPYYQAIIAYVDYNQMTMPDMESIRVQISAAAKPYAHPFGLPYNARGIIFIMSYTDGVHAEQLKQALHEESIRYRQQRQISLHFVYGSLCTAPYQITQSFQSAREAMKNRLFQEQSPGDNRQDTIEAGHNLLSLNDRQRLLNAVYARNEETVEQLLTHIQEDYAKSQALYPAGYAQKLSGELVTLLTSILYERNETPESLNPDYASIVNHARGKNDPAELFPAIKNLYKKLIRCLPETEDKKNRQTVRQCLNYIDSHLDKELRLEDLAQMVFLSPNYLGSLFKDAVGLGFMEYVTRQRMERAKKLLLVPGSKVYEVAQQVGYKNAHYFSKLFKEYAGVKPSQFK